MTNSWAIYNPAHCLELLWAVGRSERHPRSGGNCCCGHGCVPSAGHRGEDTAWRLRAASAGRADCDGCQGQQEGNKRGPAAPPPRPSRPLGSGLAYPGLSTGCGQCEQGDGWHCGQGEEQYAHASLSIPKGGNQWFSLNLMPTGTIWRSCQNDRFWTLWVWPVS